MTPDFEFFAKTEQSSGELPSSNPLDMSQLMKQQFEQYVTLLLEEKRVSQDLQAKVHDKSEKESLSIELKSGTLRSGVMSSGLNESV